MNRSQRRAGQKQPAADAAAMEMFARAGEHQRRGEPGAAMHLYKKILALKPDHVAACEQLAHIYLAQEKLDKASSQFAQLAQMAPQTLSQFATVVDRLKKLNPVLAAALADAANGALRVGASAEGQGLLAIAADPYLRAVLESTVVRDFALERWLTVLRAGMLRDALAGAPGIPDAVLPLYSALAQQCFINEYVFAVTPQETEQSERLRAALADAITQASPMQLIALATYMPLHALPGAEGLLQRKWPAAVDAVLNQQVREPLREQDLKKSMPRLTPIGGGVTAEVRQQYEENPYPRWARLAAPPDVTLVLDDHLRHQFPTTPFRPTGQRETIDILVAGCGTGRNALELAQGFRGARVLAVDLSLASLANAKRHMPASLSGSIEFAQADILQLATIGRSFDMIVVSGVLHHMADPQAGWRELLKLLKPDGLMQVGLYSANARRDVLAARAMIAQRGYRATPEDIRRCRQDLLNGPEKFDFMQWGDFFTTSVCRDLLFHVHEHQFTIPEIKDFIDQHGLNFIGFEFTPQEAHLHYRNLFARAGWSTGSLAHWDAFERENPTLFAAMYIFWVQKR